MRIARSIWCRGVAALGFAVALGSLVLAPGASAAASARSPALSPVLGIRALPLLESQAGQGEREALRLNKVAPGGRGAAAGLRAGDILLDADGQRVSDVAELEQRLLALPPGASLALRVRRAGQTLTIELKRPTHTP